MISTQSRVGIATTVLTFLAGIWVFLAPFIVDYQNVWTTLADPTRNDMWSGGVLIAVSALTLLLFAIFAVRDAAIAVRAKRSGEEPPQQN